jgi:Protein of unknown function (DUF3014)
MEFDDERRNWWTFVIPVIVVASLAGALYYVRKTDTRQPEVPAKTVATPTSGAPAPKVDNVLDPPPDPEAPLPNLQNSDPTLLEAITQLFGDKLDALIVPTDVVRHIVVTIDNLPRKKAAVNLWPLKPTAGIMATQEVDGDLLLTERNYARYEPLMKLVKTSNVRQLASTYKRLYPLFQQAYVDLGYPNGYFNNRLVEVIDHLLQTPELNGPAQLTQPSVYFEFADPELEQRSAGQKLLIRLGNNNAAAVKLKLRELRREVAKQPE